MRLHRARPSTLRLLVVPAALVAGGCTNDYGAILPAPSGPGASGAGAGATTSAGGASSSGATGGAGGAMPSTGSGGSTGMGGTGGAPLPSTPRSCLEILETGASIGDGDYEIDPDGPGGAVPLVVRCDMTTEAGGWTRFNWLHTEYPAGADPLEDSLHDCDVAFAICRGRIPETATPSQLLVRDLSDGAYATWDFGGTDIGSAMLGALRDKILGCVYAPAIDPLVETSAEPFCVDSGGCDVFKYVNAGCDGSTGWILSLDDDSHYCNVGFKLGKATGNGNCGDVDWGFLSDCDCKDEQGELYYR